MSIEVRSSKSRGNAAAGRSRGRATSAETVAEDDDGLERKALVNSARLTAALLISWTLSLVGRFLLPRVLGTERFGELSFIEGVGVLAMAFMSFGVTGFIHREVAIDRGKARHFARPLRRIQLTAGITITAGLAVTFSATSGREQALIALIFGLGQMAIVLSRVDAAYLQAAHDVRAETAATIVTKAIWFAILLGCIGAGFELYALPIAIVVSEVVRAIWLRRAMSREFGRLRRGRVRSGVDVLTRSLPYFINSLNVLFLGYSVRVLVGLLASDEAVGLLATAEVAIAVPMLLTPIIGQVTLPLLSALAARNRRLMWRRASQIIDMMAVPVVAGSLVLFALSDELVVLAFGDDFADAGLAFGLLALSVPATYFTQIVGASLIAAGREWQNTRINLYTMILVVVMTATALLVATTADSGVLTAWAAASLVIGEYVTVVALLWVQPLPPLRRSTMASMLVLVVTGAGIAIVGRDPSDPAWLALLSVAVMTTLVTLPRAFTDMMTILRRRSEIADDAVPSSSVEDGDEPEHHEPEHEHAAGSVAAASVSSPTLRRNGSGPLGFVGDDDHDRSDTGHADEYDDEYDDDGYADLDADDRYGSQDADDPYDADDQYDDDQYDDDQYDDDRYDDDRYDDDRYDADRYDDEGGGGRDVDHDPLESGAMRADDQWDTDHRYDGTDDEIDDGFDDVRDRARRASDDRPHAVRDVDAVVDPTQAGAMTGIGDDAPPAGVEENFSEYTAKPRHDRVNPTLGSLRTSGGHMDLMAARDSESTTAGGSTAATSDPATRRAVDERTRHDTAPSGRITVIRPPETDDEMSLFSVTPMRRWARYTLGAVRRHLVLWMLVFVPATMLFGMFLASSPPNYQTAATVLLAPDGASIGGGDGLTYSASRQASQVILRRDSLDRMIDEVGLVENRPEQPFFGRLSEQIFGTPTGEALAENTRDQLRQSIYVTGNESQATLDIVVLWPDPVQAVGIADLAYDIFLEDRVRAEVEPRERSVEILASRAAQASAAVDQLREEYDIAPGDGGATGSELEVLSSLERELVGELRAAEVELDEARAGVPLRYALNAAPELPKAPLAGNLVLYVAVLIAATMVATGAAFWRERPRGRVVTAWQLERFGRPIVTSAPLTRAD